MEVRKVGLVAVFSAHAEVVPKLLTISSSWPSILRARGGSSLMPQE